MVAPVADVTLSGGRKLRVPLVDIEVLSRGRGQEQLALVGGWTLVSKQQSTKGPKTNAMRVLDAHHVAYSAHYYPPEGHTAEEVLQARRFPCRAPQPQPF